MVFFTHMKKYTPFLSESLEVKESEMTKHNLHESVKLHFSFKTLERYHINRLKTLYNYLSDLSIENPLISDRTIHDETSSIEIKINNQLKALEKIFNIMDEVPSTVAGTEYRFINVYGYRSDECKGRLYGYRNTMTLLSRQCRYYLFKGLYIDFDLKNAHPTILFSYASSHNLPVQCLKQYVENR